ncbi:MAG: hypothetical protein ABSE67_14540 [Xanthobacteraceae bacterium]|jgi:hypothetical protein
MATANEAARFILVEKEEFEELLGLGVIKRQVDGNYDLAEVSGSFIQYLRNVIAGLAPPTKAIFREGPQGGSGKQ